MTKNIITHTSIKTFLAYILFFIVFLIWDFYIAQNVLTFIGALYISLAWLKYLFKDNFLKKNEKVKNRDEATYRYTQKIAMYSYLISSVFILIIALF
jgi:hypothetical protein